MSEESDNYSFSYLYFMDVIINWFKAFFKGVKNALTSWETWALAVAIFLVKYFILDSLF